MLLIDKKYFDGLIFDLEDKIFNDYYVYNSNSYWDAYKKLQAYKFIRSKAIDSTSVVSRIKLCYSILFKKYKI
jgi:hypothetical protein